MHGPEHRVQAGARLLGKEENEGGGGHSPAHGGFGFHRGCRDMQDVRDILVTATILLAGGQA